ncbi:MAG: hypothetical protein GW762_02585 [Candidatus Pacebacteria bacterium]|nr:hypothetical protein [Candidatus Paceibacterota bacterium]PIR64228.1 MAG: hypothetical protein COU64_00745 [Candidatus Pacebacteria bacterium CG10_big_fil_rev_8_21_14_0_10_40_26]PIZ79250.1 MAG: hypothetical protein COY01_02385 [Candidatus Pacebacteria bacterium CG_4_10_14_0_2_um_filter_40_20]PJA68905.1 MAG: hypothetical protein CO156_02990 [Candidatus Pacebacteria bacterium CG_4_9_14_3_um_filter_40_12]PJC42217.1 MAG: hypothetical protein CO041_01095 [Candidatus Pacebacteria bacterium CG_4_9_
MEYKRDMLHNVSLGVLLGTIAASALLVVPITNSFVTDTKVYISLYAALLVLALFIVSSIKRRAFEFILNPLVLSSVFFALTIGASSFLSSKYPVENLLGFGGTLIASGIIALLAGSVLPKRVAKPLLSTVAITGAVLTVLSGLQAVGFGPSVIINKLVGAELPGTLVFNLTGSSLVALQFIGVALVGVITHIVHKKHISKVFAITLPLLVIGLLLHGWSMLPGKDAFVQLPSWNASWSVALDTIRSPRSALIGVGAAGYRNAYSIFKPTWTNSTDQWSIIYNQAANTPLTLLTTAGFLGLIAWIVLALKAFKAARITATDNKPIAYMLVGTFALQLVLPMNVVMLTLQAILIAALVASERDKYSVARFKAMSFSVIDRNQAAKLPRKSSMVSMYLGAGVGFAAVVAGLYLVTRSYMAFMADHQASRAAAEDNAVAVYELQQRAVSLNPYLDMFRRNYAVTNLLIASAISNNADLTEEQSTQVGELLQQAVREARSATLLDESDSENWATLAEIYTNMIGVSEDASQWATQAYVAAIETNPTAPSLRVSLGTIFANQEAYGQAANIFQQAVSLKPDFTPAVYNLAVSLVKLEDWVNAQAAYKAVVQQLDPSTEDYTKVMEELDLVNEKVAEIEAAAKAQQDAAANATGSESTPLGEVKSPSLTDQVIDGGNAVETTPENDVNLTQEQPPVAEEQPAQ